MDLGFLAWNLLNGGLDGLDDRRLRGQAEVIRSEQPDIVGLSECTNWLRDEKRALGLFLDLTGLSVAGIEPSRAGDGANTTALLYNARTVELIRSERREDHLFHHALIRGLFRPLGATTDDDRFDAYATHLVHSDGDSRLIEARRFTDPAGPFPGRPGRAAVLGDFNCPDPSDPEPIWGTDVPSNMWARYRTVNPDGTFGPTDLRAINVLTQSGWRNPQSLVQPPRQATVGYWYENEPTPLHLDHVLVAGMEPDAYYTIANPHVDGLSDHRPTVLHVHW